LSATKDENNKQKETDTRRQDKKKPYQKRHAESTLRVYRERRDGKTRTRNACLKPLIARERGKKEKKQNSIS
jgi:hypothetical protein